MSGGTAPKGRQGRNAAPRWLRPAVDAAMTLVYLLQMTPGKLGNVTHELAGIGFVVLFALHHVLNRGWPRRLVGRGSLRSRAVLAGDVVLLACVVGVAMTGVLMSRSVLPALALPAVSHVVRPLHGTLAYLGLMTCALHVGLHLRMMRAYAGGRGARRGAPAWRAPMQLALSMALGAMAFVRLGVAGKLLGQPSFPDGMTPLALQLAWHLALAAPFVMVGSMLDEGGRRR